MQMMIDDFINAFKEDYPVELEKAFLYGKCYWFAQILNLQFPNGKIIYDPIDNHFIYKYNNNLYDIRGNVTEHYNFHNCLYEWNSYCNIDQLHYERIKYYCKDLLK